MTTAKESESASEQLERLPFTGDEEADRLLVSEPLALLIGFVLDQQVTVQKAFAGPLELRRRLRTLDARAISAMEVAELAEVFARRPALHRFPANMAGRTHALCQAVAREYAGDAGRVWREAGDARELRRRLLALPGIGQMKAETIFAIVTRRLGVRPTGWQELLPAHPTLADVDSPEALAAYQADKRARKAAQRKPGQPA